MSQTVITLHRPLDARQVEVRAEVLASARKLIHEHGHEGVGMEMIAADAGISRATLYRYFTSREHVVCEAALAWGHDLAAKLPAEVAGSRSLLETLHAAIPHVVREAQSNLPMVRATMTSVLALGPSADAFREAVRKLFVSLVGGGVATVAAGELDQITLLGRVFFADLALLSVGDISSAQCVAELKTAASALLARGDKP